MVNVTKSDVIHGLLRLQSFIEDLDEEDFEGFVSGYPLFSGFMPHDWRLPRNGTHQRRLCQLEVRLK